MLILNAFYLNRHQYNTLAMCNVAYVYAWTGMVVAAVFFIRFFFSYPVPFSISFYSPLRADRKLSIKCFIIMRCSLNFVQVRGFVLDVRWAVAVWCARVIRLRVTRGKW